MIIAIDNKIHIKLSDLGPDLSDEIKARLQFKNPAWGEAVGRLRAQGIANPKPFNVPQTIVGWRQSKDEMLLPRGCMADVKSFLEGCGIQVKIVDRTRRLPEVLFGFDGLLKEAQKPAVEAILARRYASLCSPTGSGKTVMGLFCVFWRKQPSLVVVHTAALMKQWAERARQFLGIPFEEMGFVGQGSRTVGKRLTIALVQTLRKCATDIAPKIGHLIVDECHHTPASTFTEAIEPFDCYYMTGLSATHKRKDGMTPLIYWHIGPLTYEVQHNVLVAGGDILQVEPIIRETDFEPSTDIDPTWQRAIMMAELCQDTGRNWLIARDIAEEAKTGQCIVLTDRKSHADELTGILCGMGVNAEVCHGDVPRTEQAKIVQAMNEGKLQVLVATGQLLGEGFDCKQLTALFLATPIKFSGRLIQYLGRVARTAEGKTSARVYDYHDVRVDVLMKAARERIRTYKKLGRAGQAPMPKKEFSRSYEK